MARFANRFPNGNSETQVDACSLPLHGNPVFYCTTPGCRARMFVRNPQKPSACFVSYDIHEHSGGYICNRAGDFRPDRYDESLFNPDDLFERILNPIESDSTSTNGTGTVGNNALIPVRTLKTLYEMCLQYRPNGSYNGYSIDDILIDYYNSPIGFTGNRIVACTYYYHSDSKQIVFMNYPAKPNKHIAIAIDNKDVYTKCVGKLRDKTHKNLSVIAGNFIKPCSPILSNPAVDVICMCNLTSVSKQICRGD